MSVSIVETVVHFRCPRCQKLFEQKLDAIACLQRHTTGQTVTMYLHGDKDTNYEIGEKIGLTGDALTTFGQGTLYEVKFDLFVHPDGRSTILKVNDRPLASPKDGDDD